MVRPSDLRVVGPRLLLRCEKRPDTSKGGIIIPQGYTAVDRVQERAGKVVAKGRVNPDLKKVRAPGDNKFFLADRLQAQLNEVELGARVLFRGFLAEANNLTKQYDITDEEGNEYAIIHIEDVLGLITDDTEIGTWHTTGQ